MLTFVTHLIRFISLTVVVFVLAKVVAQLQLIPICHNSSCDSFALAKVVNHLDIQMLRHRICHNSSCDSFALAKVMNHLD